MKASSPGNISPQTNAWRPSQVVVVVSIVLLLGILIGYLFHHSSPSGSAVNSPPSTGQSASVSGRPTAGANGPNSVVQSLLESLKTNPDDSSLLASIGNAYYDQKNYDQAISYYRKYLKRDPRDVNVRTDLGTAIWYSGNPDGAIHEYKIAFRYQPDYANTLLNMGIVQWQGKQDRLGALQSWQRLLATHPDYPDRPRVEQFIQKVQGQLNSMQAPLQ